MVIVEYLIYDMLVDCYDMVIFIENQMKQDFVKVGEKFNKYIYDYVVVDLQVECNFVIEFDISIEVVVYVKFLCGFFILILVGDYNFDWVIVFEEGSVKYVYFVVEIKGLLLLMQFKGVEFVKIDCVCKFFELLNGLNGYVVQYDIVIDYG